jgi:glycosyltransferase involved in cell wall biosynthesis
MDKKYDPKVTIAIPTYNRADNYLKQTLASALNQTYENIEVIVSDNCSTDDTETVVNNFNDLRIRYFRQSKNIGANNNFNFCLKQARGEYFLLLLDDDLIDPDFVETCMMAVKNYTEIGIIRTGSRVIDQDGNLLNETPNTVEGISTEEFFRKWFAWKTALYLCSTIFNTNRLREIGGFKSKHNLFQDVLAEFKLAAKYGRVDVWHIKASFRQHPSAMTSVARIGHWCEDSLFLLDSMCDMVSDKKALIRKEGRNYFSRFNIELCKKTKSPISRFTAYLEVFKHFSFVFLYQMLHLTLSRSPVYSPLRNIKRSFTGR